ncbi:MAG: hypothetical protein QNK05_11390 [Myxococcota bacterium]|nr:hypothetical protein [Myxococcota bacterium]
MSHDFEPFFVQARCFLDRFHRPSIDGREAALDGSFASAAEGSADLYGAADAAYALFILGDLEERTTPESRQRWIARIQACQDASTGWFDGPLLPGHGIPHATAFATGALVLLGGKPAHPLRYAATLFSSRPAVDAWLDGFRWNQIWTGSHAAGAAAAAFDAPAELPLPSDWITTLLDALSARVDSTGFWKRALHDRLLRRPNALDLGGAAHFWWLYDRSGRPIPHPERALDGILGLQRSNGLWGNRVFGGAFPQGLDFDALHGLRIAWRDAGSPASRVPALQSAISRYARVAHAMLTPAGAVERCFRAPHKLVGTLDALAELEALGRTVLGESVVGGAELTSALTHVSWQ